MPFLLDFGGDAVTDVYLTFRHNHGTRGDAQVRIPTNLTSHSDRS